MTADPGTLQWNIVEQLVSSGGDSGSGSSGTVNSDSVGRLVSRYVGR